MTASIADPMGSRGREGIESTTGRSATPGLNFGSSLTSFVLSAM
ncbi:MAG TPA: hypothetical protein VID48_14400 [Solirubrobacteraceae bacterium]